MYNGILLGMPLERPEYEIAYDFNDICTDIIEGGDGRYVA